MKKITQLMFLALLIFSASTLQAQSWFVYGGDFVPQDDVDGWEYSSDNPGANFVEAVVDDEDIAGNKLFQYIQPDEWSTDGAKNARKYYRRPFADANVVKDFTVVLRLKGIAIDSLDNEAAIQLDYKSDYRETIKISQSDSTIGFSRSDSIIKVDADLNKWHIYRFVYKDMVDSASVAMYVDENTEPVYTGITKEADGDHYLRFGDSGSARVASLTDWIVMDTTGGYAPGEGAAIPDSLSLNYYVAPEVVAHWKLDDLTIKEEISDMVGNTVGAGFASVDGVDGKAIDLAAAVDTGLILIEDAAATAALNFSTESFSVSVLAKWDPAGDQQTLIIKGDNGTDGPNGNGNRFIIFSKEKEIRFTIDDDVNKTKCAYGITAGDAFNAGGWNHIVGVRNVEDDKLYLHINGVEVASVLDESDTLDIDGQNMIIGNYHTKDKKINGAMDDVKVFSGALSADAVKAMYDAYEIDIEELILVTGIELSALTTSIDIAATTQVSETITPWNATDKTVNWSSSDKAIATVDASGLVTGVSAGAVTITATANDGSGITGTINIDVNPSNVDMNPLNNISLFPNPFANSINITNMTDVTDVIISNVIGQTINTISVTDSNIEINTDMLEKGIYMVTIIDVNNNSRTEKMVKN